MAQRIVNVELLSREITFTTSRSGGPGGQNVNKVNSKVTLQFDVVNSMVLTDEEKEVLSGKLASRMTREGVVLIPAQESRSQLDNRELVKEKFNRLLAKAFEKRKVRKATKATKTSKQKRLKTKKVVSEKKQWRKKPDV